MTLSPRKTDRNLYDTIEGYVTESKWEDLRSFCINKLCTTSDGLSMDDQIYLRIALLKSQYCIGDLQAADDSAKELKKCLKCCDDKNLVARAKYQMGLLFMSAGKTALAEDELNESYVFYKHCDNHKGAINALNMLAGLASTSGRLHKALDYLDNCVQYCELNDKMDMQISATRNMGRVLTFMGRLNEALEAFAPTESSTADTRNQIYSHLSLAFVWLLKYDRDNCRGYLTKAKVLIDKSEDYYELRLFHEYFGLLEYTFGNYRKARAYYRKVLDMPEPTASAVAQTLRMLTDVYIAEEKFKKAFETAKKAEEAITKINERIELGALYRAYGQIYTHKGETDTALDYFKKSIDLLDKIGALYELALSHFACGRSESYSYNDRRHHLEAARALFEKMEVTKRTDQIDRAISELNVLAIPNIITSGSGRGVPTIIAVSSQMKEIIAKVDNLAESNLATLLTGETGTGKDLLASYIHYKSGRKGRFISINAAAVPHDMIESELFGYKKGAFTGAINDKLGRFELADGGTFYLNEIADASSEFQAKLLEVLETHEIWRLGENEKREVNFRLISATNHDLRKQIAAGAFRVDLYHRLNKIRIDLPPLRERPEDIPALVLHFLLEQSSSIDSSDLRIEKLGSILSSAGWHGNVRELHSEVVGLWVDSGGDLGRMIDMAKDLEPEFKRQELQAVLDQTGWNRRETARRLGVSEATVRNRIKQYKLSP